MSDKITALTAMTTPTDDDLMAVVNAPGTVPVTQKITWANIKAALKAYNDTLYPAKFSGTSFPGSPSDGDLYYRTDLGLLCFYDLAHTQWLTVSEYTHGTAGASWSVNGTNEQKRARIDYAKYFTRIAISTKVATTNDGTKYWTVSFQGENATQSAQTAILTIDTSGDTADTITTHDAAPGTANPTNQTFLSIVATKTSTPGDLSVWAQAYYRLIVT